MKPEDKVGRAANRNMQKSEGKERILGDLGFRSKGWGRWSQYHLATGGGSRGPQGSLVESKSI